MARRTNRAGIGFRGGAEDKRTAWRALSAEDLAEVLDRLTDGIFVYDREWRIEYANEPAAAMSGKPHAELLGKRLWDAFPEMRGHPFQLANEEAMRSGEPQRLVERFESLGRWFEGRMFPQEDKLVVLVRDVTEQQQTAEELREHVERISEAERIVGFGIWEWNVASGRVRWSEELHRIYGLLPGEFAGSVDAFMERVHPDDREKVWANVARSLESLEPFAFEERVVRPDGSARVLLSQGRVIAGSDGTAAALVGICHDVTDRAQVEQALGASESRMRAVIDKTPSIVTVKDLDGRYLMVNAEAVKIIGLGSTELLGRRCVDVFPPEIADRQRLDEQRAASNGEPVYGEAVLEHDGEPRSYVTVTFPLPGDDGFPAETCTIATDVTERKELEDERRERLGWTGRIESALAENRLLAFAQPVVDLGGGERVACELLVRMQGSGERRELIEPDEFLPAAERYGLVQRIDLWMTRQALARADAETCCHVNVSAVTVSDPRARQQIAALLAAAPGAARQLVFEITETADLVHLEAARAFADQVGHLGARLALDDFGVGFGSFRYLRSLPLSLLKIDISFVRGLTTSPHDRQVVRSVIGIAREFGLETVAEGVEDEATLELVREMGADFAQGFQLGHPAPIESQEQEV